MLASLKPASLLLGLDDKIKKYGATEIYSSAEYEPTGRPDGALR